MTKKNNSLFSAYQVSHQVLKTTVFVVILAAAIGLILWNMSGLNRAIGKSTESYVYEVSEKWTDAIEARFDTYELALQLVADSIPRLSDEEAVEEFLNRKSRILEFDQLVTVDRNRKIIPDDFKFTNYEDISGIAASFEKEETIVSAEGDDLMFSTPVYENGSVDKVLVGIRSRENVQALIQSKSFGGSSLTCIIDSEGQVIISPADVKPFLQLDDIFATEKDDPARRNVLKMEQDIIEGKSDVFTFTAADGSRLVLSYHPLGVNDWVLLTLVAADLISGETNTYVLYSIVIVGAMVLLFGGFFLNLLCFYRKSKRGLEKIAFCDPVTGGRNNAAFQLEYREKMIGQEQYPHTIALMNVKRFKFINENMGIQSGNEILKLIYHVLSSQVGEDEMVARGEADYFFLYLKDAEETVVRERLTRMVRQIHDRAIHSELRYYLEMRQGACIVREPGQDVSAIQERARIACRYPNVERECVFYSSQIAEPLKKEQELNAIFDHSIEKEEFQVFLQPKVRLEDGRTQGAEALVRWITSDGRMILPSDFIPVFEKNENICRLDYYVFEKVCQCLRRWMDNGIQPVPIAVNLSRAHVKNPDFLEEFAKTKERYAIPDGMLELELTESIFFDEEQRELGKQGIDKMHAEGFLCSLDDFGVGFSALALLKEFNVDTIKLDRQFFLDIDSEKSRSIIAAFLRLGEKLNIHIVAEGIETKKQLDYLKSVRCNMVQGYIFSKPLPIPDFEKWRKKRGE